MNELTGIRLHVLLFDCFLPAFESGLVAFFAIYGRPVVPGIKRSTHKKPISRTFYAVCSGVLFLVSLLPMVIMERMVKFEIIPISDFVATSVVGFQLGLVFTKPMCFGISKVAVAISKRSEKRRDASDSLDAKAP